MKYIDCYFYPCTFFKAADNGIPYWVVSVIFFIPAACQAVIIYKRRQLAQNSRSYGRMN